MSPRSGLRFSEADIAYLLGLFSHRFLDWLGLYRFSGEVVAVNEGTPLFANEPILEITAPIAEAQVLETLAINQVHLATLMASKAARVVTAAAGRRVVDFGSRGAQGTEAAHLGARAFYIAGVRRHRTSRLARVTAFQLLAPWRTLSSRPATPKGWRSPASRKSFPRRRSWSTLTTRSKACATS